MDEAKKNQVLAYLSNNNTKPLEFSQDNKLTYLDLDDLVIKILDKTNYFGSVCENIKETSAKRARSVLDIWRHVIFFEPEITIFDVMDSLYRQSALLVGHYCSDVRRRVFKLQKNMETWGFFPKRSSGFGDEFNLQWEDWKKIEE